MDMTMSNTFKSLLKMTGEWKPEDDGHIIFQEIDMRERIRESFIGGGTDTSVIRHRIIPPATPLLRARTPEARSSVWTVKEMSQGIIGCPLEEACGALLLSSIGWRESWHLTSDFKKTRSEMEVLGWYEVWREALENLARRYL